MAPRLETRRLRLDPLTHGDFWSLRSVLIDPDVRRWASTGGGVPSDAGVRWTIRESLSTLRRHGTGAFALRLRDDGAFAGYAGLLPERLFGQDWLELSVVLWPRHWGRGIASEACRAILDHAFETAGVRRVLACTLEPNGRSAALVMRLGFRQVGTRPARLGALRVFVRERP